MADLGAIASTYDEAITELTFTTLMTPILTQPVTFELVDNNTFSQTIPIWAVDGIRTLNDIGVTGTLSGKVQVEGVDAPYINVRLYYRPTGQMIKQMYTDVNGEWSFDGLETGSNDYYVLAIDPDGGTQYNVVVYDRVEPT